MKYWNLVSNSTTMAITTIIIIWVWSKVSAIWFCKGVEVYLPINKNRTQIKTYKNPEIWNIRKNNSCSRNHLSLNFSIISKMLRHSTRRRKLWKIEIVQFCNLVTTYLCQSPREKRGSTMLKILVRIVMI